jgi:Flp pilus assembly CpaF family ATPase
LAAASGASERWRTPAVTQAALDVLRDRLPAEMLDPFAPADARGRVVRAVLREAIAGDRQRGGPLASVPGDDGDVLLQLFADTLGWGPAQSYVDDTRVQEVQIINGTIRVQEAGAAFVTVPEHFGSAAEVRQRAQLLADRLDVKLDAANPQATLPLAHGTRMHVSIAPIIANNGVLVCIRRGRTTAWDLGDVLARRSLDEPVLELLELLCRARCSFLVAGHTGSGKTGLLEALANSWPGDPHILSVEDHTMEIVVRRTQSWTRELVDTKKNKAAFGDAAREALRQTPNLVLPGETRGMEAGAILSLVTSDHPVITTIHARTCADAALRFARCATLPNSYMYEGRFEDALSDVCGGFDVAIKIEHWEALGRRVITEVALLNGVERTTTGLRPITVPLVTLEVDEESGDLSWRCLARPSGKGMLEWVDGVERTPEPLREKLVRARALAVARNATSLTVIAQAVARAEQLLLSGENERAMATVMQAWGQRRDDRLPQIGQRVLAQDPQRFAAPRQAARAARAHVEALMASREWALATAALDALLATPSHAVMAVPAEGWGSMERQIADGQARVIAAERALRDADGALATGDAHAARRLLDAVPITLLPPPLELEHLRGLERVYTRLVETGEASRDTLATITTRRISCEATMHEATPFDATSQEELP